jgi:uncharacterized membrane protein
MEKKELIIKKLFKEAYDIAEEHLWVLVGTFALIFFGGFVLSALAKDNILLNLLISSLMSMTLILFGLSYVWGSRFSFEMVFEHFNFRKFVYYFIASITTSVIILVGFVLFIVPGCIAMSTLIFTPYLIMNKNLKPIDAMKESRRLTKGIRMKIFMMVLLSVLVNILGLICFGFGLLFTIPLTLIAFSLAYKKTIDTPMINS